MLDIRGMDYIDYIFIKSHEIHILKPFIYIYI